MKNKIQLGLSMILGIICSFTLTAYMGAANNNRIYISLLLIGPLAVFIYMVAFRCGVEIMSNYSRSKKYVFYIFCLLFSLGLLLSLSLIPNNSLSFSFKKSLIIYMGLFIFMYIIIQFLLLKSKNLSWTSSKVDVSRKKIILYALPCIIVWMFYLIAYFPGGMTPDSLDQWGQIISLKFNDWHPVAHTVLILLITQIWNSPAAVAVVQILTLALVFGYGMYTLEKLGLSRKVIYFITLLFSLNPVNGFMNIILWKDVIYSTALLLFTILIINIVATNGDWIKERKHLAIFIVSSLAVIFFRHNGILPFSITMLLIAFYYKRYFKKFLLILSLILVVYMIVRGPVYKAMNVIPAESGEAFGIPVNQLAAIIQNGGNLDNREKQELNEILPLDLWAKNYNPYSTNPIKFDEKYNVKRITDNKGSFIKLWFSSCIKNPKTAIKAYAKLASLTWQIQEPADGYTYTIATSVGENSYGLSNRVLSPKIKQAIDFIEGFTHDTRIRFLFWRPALPMFIIVFFGFLSIMKNGYRMLLVLAPIATNHLSVMIAIPAQDFRYLYSNTLLLLPLIAFLLIKDKKKSDYVI